MWNFAPTTGSSAEQLAAARKRFLAAFAEFDADADGTLDQKELGVTKATQFQSLQAYADRNADGKLDRKELDAWLDLQEQIAKGHVLLTVLDHGARAVRTARHGPRRFPLRAGIAEARGTG